MTDAHARPPRDVTLTGERVRLRPVRPGDRDRLREILAEPSVARWWGPGTPDSAVDDWLEDDPAMVGQGVLLLGAIHNVRIPEEEEILRAIEDERERQAREPEEEGADGGPEGDGGRYLM